MTREEAKTRLIAMKAQFELLCSMYGLEISDVFDVAIEALEQEPCNECTMYELGYMCGYTDAMTESDFEE